MPRGNSAGTATYSVATTFIDDSKDGAEANSLMFSRGIEWTLGSPHSPALPGMATGTRMVEMALQNHHPCAFTEPPSRGAMPSRGPGSASSLAALPDPLAPARSSVLTTGSSDLGFPSTQTFPAGWVTSLFAGGSVQLRPRNFW